MDKFYRNPTDEERSHPKNLSHERTGVLFDPYIAYRSDDRWVYDCMGNRHRERFYRGICTSCGNALPDEELTSGYGEPRHQGEMRCPYCMRISTTINLSKLRSGNTYNQEKNIAYVHVADENLVYMRVFTVFLDINGEIRFGHELARYRLEPGDAVSEYSKFDYNEYRWKFVRTKKPKRISYDKMVETSYNKKELEKTFLRYNQLDAYRKNCGEMIRSRNYSLYRINGFFVPEYLCKFVTCPQMEMVAKTGVHWAINDLVNEDKKNRELLNWNAKCPNAFLKLSKSDTKAYLSLPNKNKELLEAIQKARKEGFTEKNCSVSDLQMLQEIYPRNMKKIMSHIVKYGWRVSDVLRYIDEKNATMYLDYLEAAEAIGYELTVHNVMFPKNLMQAHDQAYRTREYAENIELEKKEKKRIQKAKRLYEWEDEQFFVRVPEHIADIILEGKHLHHCVGGYAERHMKGNTTILFLRRKNAPDESYYTIEIDEDRVRQAYGYRNRMKPIDDPEVKMFYTAYTEHIKEVFGHGAGSKQSTSVGAGNQHD